MRRGLGGRPLGGWGRGARRRQGGGGGAYRAFASDFDGTNDYMTRGADLTGIADAKVGTLSLWMRIDSGDGTARFLMEPGNDLCTLQFNTSNVIFMKLSDGTNADFTTANTALTAGAAWYHHLISWDRGNNLKHWYLNDVDDLVGITLKDFVVDYTGGNFAVGSTASGTNKFNGCLAEVYFDSTAYTDFSVEANRRKFISAAGKPVNLGADGSLPSGSQPILYLNNPFSSFETNKGTGGDFTVTGALAACSSAP